MHINPLLLLILQIALILGLSRLMGLIFAYLRQPQVMGEMIAGIMLGPSLLGWAFPAASRAIFPAETIPYLNTLSQIGVIFFLFLVGLELDPKLIRNRGHAAVVISHASIIAPFLLGAGVALYLYPNLFNHASYMRFTSVALFMGAAMSITAFPVLARILTERNLHKTHLGAIAITCAAVDDVTAWCMLAFVIAVARADGLRPALITAAAAAVYVPVMFFVVRPFLKRLELIYERQGRLSQNVLAVIFLLVLASAYTTEKIGIHALFGAFLMGAVMPKGTSFIRTLSEKLEDYTVVFLLPIFFAYTGLRTEIGILNNGTLWWYTGLIIFAACAGKFGGSAIAAVSSGIRFREAAAIGILMNTRGLMELVILNIGKDLGVITSAVFAMMVIMAIVTTGLTTPILHWVYKPLAEGVPGEQPKVRKFTALIPVSFPASGGPLAYLASLLAEKPDMPRQIVALHLQRPVDRDAYRSGLPESQTALAPLDPLLAAAKARDVPVETIAFVSRDVPSDIARIARMREANLILMGFHKPVFGQAILGGTVHRVLTGSDCDVAVFVDRGMTGPHKILVPYLGGKHDRLALDLAGRVARNSQATLTVLHVVRPNRGESEKTLQAKQNVARVFDDPTQPTPVEFRVIEDPSPVDAVVNLAKDYDLVVIGVEEEWGLASHLFGWRPERVARDSQTSLLIVRKHGAYAVAPAPPPVSKKEQKNTETAAASAPS